MNCLSDDVVFEFVAGLLAAEMRASVEDHIDVCDECRGLVAELARQEMRTPSAGAGLSDVMQDEETRVRPVAPRTLEAGDQVGRYRVTRLIAAGGMGAVHEAFDPELDRRIALKVLRPDLTMRAGYSARLLREAKAMARLSHPNVVAVHDLGMHGDRVFIAMEYVDGDTLKTWLQARRSSAEIIEVFAAAGRGLAIAHRNGMVHRDFKPANVLIGVDGRVRVTDFGLAHLEDPAESVAEAGAAGEVDDDEPTAALRSAVATATGGWLGTPAYMAPEQFRCTRADSRTDQFSFCVALYEALYQARPFAGESAEELSESVLNHAPRRPPEVPTIPPSTRAALLRGLSSNPDDRFGTMDELLDALRPMVLPRRRRSRRMAAAVLAAIAGTGIAGFLAVRSGDDSRSPSPSTGQGTRAVSGEPTRPLAPAAGSSVAIEPSPPAEVSETHAHPGGETVREPVARPGGTPSAFSRRRHKTSARRARSPEPASRTERDPDPRGEAVEPPREARFGDRLRDPYEPAPDGGK